MESLSQIFQGHRHESGFVELGRHRLKEFCLVGTSSAGSLDVFDTEIVPTAATYAQSGTTVTVTKSSHGLATGDIVGISFTSGTGGTAQPGNYEITVASSSTFTVTMLNSDTITGTPACSYVSYTPGANAVARRWIMSKNTSASDTFANVFQVPSGGFLVRNGIYFSISNLLTADVFYE